jgi:hypothetical protein
MSEAPSLQLSNMGCGGFPFAVALKQNFSVSRIINDNDCGEAALL